MVETTVFYQVIARKVRVYEAFGRIDTVRNLADAHGINRETVISRLRAGFPIEEALTRPIGAVMGRRRGGSKLSSERRGPAGGGARKSASNSGFSP